MKRIEDEILYASRNFDKTQELFTGAPLTAFFPNPVSCSWYGAETNPHRGAFCMVQEGAGFGDLVGEFVRIQYKQRDPIVVYCIAESPEITAPIALARRAWNEIEALFRTEIRVYARVIR
jgi:hypothetical protein